MVSAKNWQAVMGISAFAVAAVLVGGALGFMPKSGLAGPDGGQVVVTTAGACPSTGLTNLKFKPSYIDSSSSNTETVANTTVAVYAAGESTVLATTTTGTAGYSLIGTANCGGAMTAFIGDGGTTYYYVQKDLPADKTTGADTNVAAVMKKKSAATISFSNTSTFGAAAVDLAGVGSGATSSDAVLKIKAGQEYFGDGGIEVCATYNTTNVTKVSFGASAVEMSGVDPNIAAAVNMQSKCYEVNQQLFNYNTIDLPIVIQAKSGVTPVTSHVDIYINDKSAYLKNGKAIMGYWNGDTNADIGATAVSKTAAIIVNP